MFARPAMPSSIPIRLPSGGQVEAQVRARRGTRRLMVRIDPVGRGVILAVPPRTGRAVLEDMARTHAQWIESHLQALPPPMPFAEGALIRLRGEPVRLARRDGRGVPVLEPPAAPGEPRILRVAAAPDRFAARVAMALKTLAHTDAVEAAARLAPLLEGPPRKVTVRDARSRWGSCTSRGDIMINWRLIGAPPSVLFYVMAHELAHLKELNHSPLFWAETRRLMPDYAPARAWLKAHGSSLHALGAAA